MNITSILPNYKGRIINRDNSQILSDSVSELSPLAIGKNGTVLSDILDLSKKIKRCGSSAVTGKRKNSSGGYDHKVLELHRCGVHKLCPNCADAVSGDRIRRISSALSINWDRAQYCYMLTFTLKDGHDLFERLSVLNEGFRVWQLKGRKRKGNKHSLGEYSRVSGGSKSLEIKLGENSRAWHPHIHAIVFTDTPIDFRTYDEKKKAEASKLFDPKKDVAKFKEYMIEHGGVLHPYENESGVVALSKLSKEWRESTNGEGLNIRCDVVFTPSTRPEKFSDLFKSLKGKTQSEIKADKGLSVIRSVKYSLKYSVKAGDLDKMSPAQIFELVDCMKNLRTNEPLGFVRNYKKDLRNVSTCLELDDMILKEVRESEQSISTIPPLSVESSKKKAERESLREWCAGAEITKSRTSDSITDSKIDRNRREIEKCKAWKPFTVSSGVYEKLESAAMEVDEYGENARKLISRIAETQPEIPSELSDEPKAASSPAYSALFYELRPDMMRSGDRGSTALWQLGADIHREFQSEVAFVVAEYRRDRDYLFYDYTVSWITAENYVEGIDYLKENMRNNVKALKRDRDRKISSRTSGLYYDILNDERYSKKKRDFTKYLKENRPEAGAVGIANHGGLF